MVIETIKESEKTAVTKGCEGGHRTYGRCEVGRERSIA